MSRDAHPHPCPVHGCPNKVYSYEKNAAGCLVVDWIRCWDHAPVDATVLVEYGKKAGWQQPPPD